MKRILSTGVLTGVVLLSGWGGCRKEPSPVEGQAKPDAALPCRAKQDLEAFSRFHADRIAPLGLSGKGLFSGGADPVRLRSLARLMRKTAGVMSEFHARDAAFGHLVARRTKMFQDLASAWDKVAADLEASDKAAFRRDREALIGLRAKDVVLRRQFGVFYSACHLSSPF